MNFPISIPRNYEFRKAFGLFEAHFHRWEDSQEQKGISQRDILTKIEFGEFDKETSEEILKYFSAYQNFDELIKKISGKELLRIIEAFPKREDNYGGFPEEKNPYFRGNKASA